VVPMTTSFPSDDDKSSWEIREGSILPALRWILRGLIHTSHLAPVGNRESPSDLGVLVPNHVYFVDETQEPFDVVDVRELTRRKRANDMPGQNSSEDEVEMSEYEKARAERVARNTERLQSLGLA
jgi:hypothetical protein